MNTAQGSILGAAPKTPWHLWVVGIASLLWNSGGASDYTQVKLGVESYLQQGADMVGVPVAQIIAYYDAFPIWANISWACGLWGAVAGSLLLLFRSKYAFHVFVLSLLGLIVTTIHTATSPMPMGDLALAEAARTFQTVFAAVIWVVTLILIYYSHRLSKAGLLR